MDTLLKQVGYATGTVGERMKALAAEIVRQREKARRALGARLDVKAFNDTVVLRGNVPLEVLAQNVDEYLRSARR